MRVLFTSVVQPIGGSSPDVYSWNKRTSSVKLRMSFLNHPGLSFLRANIPGLAILEYPTSSAFQAALRKPPEILGISFYVNETELALDMADYARRCGVKEVWAGNYGAYSPEVERFFDRIFTGWGEASVARALGLEPTAPSELVHPALYGTLATNLSPLTTLHGFLYTSRGCPYSCNFCQTPDFYGKATTIPLESIERVLQSYARRGVITVHLLDENFGIFPRHATEVIRLLKKYNLKWLPLARTDVMLKNFDEWQEHGLFGAHLGVESLNAHALVGADKRLGVSESRALLRKLSHNNMIVQVFYIIGFPEDTPDSIREDIDELAGLDVDIAQVQTLTPYPRTRLRASIEEEYGMLDYCLSRYNSRNLVWAHPHITPSAMRDLQEWANRRLFTSGRALRTLSKVLLHDCTPALTTAGVIRNLGGVVQAGRSGNYRKYRMQLQGAREWGRCGWYAYEEMGQSPPVTG